MSLGERGTGNRERGTGNRERGAGSGERWMREGDAGGVQLVPILRSIRSSSAMRSHRSLLAWQEAREVSRACVRLAQIRWGSASAPLLGQLQRAAISVQVNIAEGYGLATGPQFRRHLRIAYGSALETGELLELGLDTGLIAQEDTTVLERCRRSQRLLLGLLKKKGMNPA